MVPLNNGNYVVISQTWDNGATVDAGAVTFGSGTTGVHGIDFRHGTGESGIVIGDKSMWRKGIASEAMAMRTRFAFRELNLHKIRSRTFMENTASWRALEKAGYRQSGVLREEFYRGGRWHDVWCGEVLRDDWERAQTEQKT